MRPGIVIDGQCGDRPMKVELDIPSGQSAWFIVANRFYNGCLHLGSKGEWRIDMAPNTCWSGDDIQIMIDLIEDYIGRVKRDPASYPGITIPAAYERLNIIGGMATNR